MLWTGGDGAPAWTLNCVGFDILSLHASGAAFTHQGYLAENGADAILPRMTWPSNHHKLAAGPVPEEDPKAFGQRGQGCRIFHTLQCVVATQKDTGRTAQGAYGAVVDTAATRNNYKNASTP